MRVNDSPTKAPTPRWRTSREDAIRPGHHRPPDPPSLHCRSLATLPQMGLPHLRWGAFRTGGFSTRSALLEACDSAALWASLAHRAHTKIPPFCTIQLPSSAVVTSSLLRPQSEHSALAGSCCLTRQWCPRRPRRMGDGERMPQSPFAGRSGQSRPAVQAIRGGLTEAHRGRPRSSDSASRPMRPPAVHASRTTSRGMASSQSFARRNMVKFESSSTTPQVRWMNRFPGDPWI